MSEGIEGAPRPRRAQSQAGQAGSDRRFALAGVEHLLHPGSSFPHGRFTVLLGAD